MSALTDRGKMFKQAIAGFIEARRESKLKGNEDGTEAASKYDYATWLAEAARRVGQIQAVTHVLKATHPAARGSNLYAAPATLPQHAEIGSHLLIDGFSEDVVGNAAALDVFAFLKTDVDGRRLLEWMQAGDIDLKAALSDDEKASSTWMSAFASLVRPDGGPASHPMAKQVYWLTGQDPLDNGQYHLLQPMFSSSLAQAIHSEVRDARFGEVNKQARQAFRDKKASDTPYLEYRNVVIQKLGGSNPQNISKLNRERSGINYLLASLPPPEWNPSVSQLLKQDTSFVDLYWFGDMRDLLQALITFLKGDPAPTMETRQRREVMEQAVGQELAIFGAAIRGQFDPGWTRNPDCRLPRCEKLWLDPGRSELPPRDDPQHLQWKADDEDFITAYHRGDWADEMAERFGDWLNAQLHQAGVVAVSLPERKHWARQSMVEVAWPTPLQRRAAKGAT